MKNKQKTFSLSHYFNKLSRGKEEKKEIKVGAAPTPTNSLFAAHLSVVKSLMGAAKHEMQLMELAKTSHLNLNACKEIVESLKNEEFIEIEPDHDTGNDLIRLIQKGEEALE